MWDDLERAGHRPFPLPIGVNLGDDKPYPQSSLVLGKFDGFPDPTESKADAHIIGINPALEHGNVTLRINRYVEKLITNSSGNEIKEVTTQGPDGVENYSGDLVVVCCGAINTAALLLRSANDEHPNGLANRSGGNRAALYVS